MPSRCEGASFAKAVSQSNAGEGGGTCWEKILSLRILTPQSSGGIPSLQSENPMILRAGKIHQHFFRVATPKFESCFERRCIFQTVLGGSSRLVSIVIGPPPITGHDTTIWKGNNITMVINHFPEGMIPPSSGDNDPIITFATPSCYLYDDFVHGFNCFFKVHPYILGKKGDWIVGLMLTKNS